MVWNSAMVPVLALHIHNVILDKLFNFQASFSSAEKWK